MSVVTLVGRPGCHLCDDARTVVTAVVAETGDELVEVSIDDDLELLDRFGEMIPVVLIDGAYHAHFVVAPGLLRAALVR
mgnify:CR=1 FL=1